MPSGPRGRVCPWGRPGKAQEGAFTWPSPGQTRSAKLWGPGQSWEPEKLQKTPPRGQRLALRGSLQELFLLPQLPAVLTAGMGWASPASQPPRAQPAPPKLALLCFLFLLRPVGAT